MEQLSKQESKSMPLIYVGFEYIQVVALLGYY